MDPIQRLERLILISKGMSKFDLRVYRMINREDALYIKKVAFDNLKVMKELEEAFKKYKSGDRSDLDYFIIYRARWMPLSETNYKIENLLKTIWLERIFFGIISYKYNKEIILCSILI